MNQLPGYRIAQLLVYQRFPGVLVDAGDHSQMADETERGPAGFGSTGR